MNKTHIHFFGKNFGDIYEIYKIIKDHEDFKVTYNFYNIHENTGPDDGDFIVTSHHTEDHYKGKVIHCQHGFGVASKVPHEDHEAFRKDYIKHFDALSLYGYAQAEDYMRVGFPTDRIMVVGCPSSIPLLSPVDEQDRASFLKELGQDPSKKTLTYIPSWDMGTPRGIFSLWHKDDKESERVEKFCQYITEDLNLNLIIRLHEKHRYSGDWGKKYKHIFNKYGVFFTYLEGYPQATKFLKYSDLFVGDYSNTNTYVYIMNKPIVHIGSKGLSRWVNKKGGWPMKDRAGYVVDTFEELLTSIKDSLDNPDKFEEMRNRVVKENIGYVGDECKTQVVEEFRRIVECIS